MSDELTDDERRVRALTRTTLELEFAYRASAFERDRMIVELYDSGRATQNGMARAARLHWTRIARIRKDWHDAPQRWAARKAEIEAALKALDEK